MKRIQVDPAQPSPEALAHASAVLAEAGVVAFPTETVYGLCADASNPEAVRRLYGAKGRDAGQACAYLLPDRDTAARHAGELPPIARRIAERLWPGPVTLVVPAKDGSGTVGLRLTDAALPRALASAVERPLLQTSANRSGEPPALDADAVVAALGDAVDLLLDGGAVPGGTSSTVVQCDERMLTVLRSGAVSDQQLLVAATELTLVACTGNICRSPLAEALLRKEMADRFGCATTEVLRFGHRFGSFGTMAMIGKRATEEAALTGEELGVDLSPHRSRVFSMRMLERARRVFCLAKNHYEFLQPYFAQRADDLLMLDPKGYDIPDPYGKSIKVYRKTAARIQKAIDKRADELAED